mgnify:FL=1
MIWKIKKSQLNEQIISIKHHEKSFINNFLDIGRVLHQIQQIKSYKARYDTFEACVEDNFSFTRAYAYEFIKIYNKYGNNVKRFNKIKEYGIKFLIISVKIPDDKIDEVIEKVRKKPFKPLDTLKVEVKRLSKQTGTEPHYSDSKEEHQIKLVRQFDSIRDKFSSFQASIESQECIKRELKDSVKIWKDSASKYGELDNLILESDKIMKALR